MSRKRSNFFSEMKEGKGDIQRMDKLEKTLVDNRDDVEYELKQAKEKKLDPQLIDNLEKKLVQVKAQLRFVGEDAEAALKQKDEVLRAKLSGQTNEKKRETTDRNFAPLGQLFQSSTPVDLTKSEDDFGVRCIRHIFTHYILFQFDISNTLTDQLLEQVTVQMDGSTEGFEIVHYEPCSVIKCNHSGTTYTLVELPDHSSAVTGTLSCTMKYRIKDCDPITGQSDDDDDDDDEEGYPDEFMLENAEVTISDHVQKVLKPNWSALWEEIGVENEFEDNYTLSIPTLQECVNKIISYMGMQPYEQLDKVAEGKASHTLYLTGIYRGGHDVLVRAKMALEETSTDPSTTTITMQLTIRSTDRSAVQVIASAIAYINKQ